MKKEMWQKKYFILAILALLVILSYKIVQPYIITLISTFVLAYLAHPLYKYLVANKFNKTIAAGLCVFAVLLVIIAPSLLIVNEVTIQSTTIMSDPAFSDLVENTISPFVLEKFGVNLMDLVDNVVTYAEGYLKNMIVRLPVIIVSVLLMIMGIFYLLLSWEDAGNHLKKFLPVKNKDLFTQELKEKTNSLVFGSITIAILEAIIAYIGFAVFGIKSAALFAVLIFFLAFIPALGSSIVWAPLAAYYFFVQDTTLAIAVLVIGVIIGYGVDTFLRAKLLGKNAKINPFIMLLGILGGIPVFGIFGFIIGPLVLAYTIHIVENLLDS
ncbi:MAG: AI-2E family transporter [Nanoarchaeota archaeon]|nr:AI-2E family transporter [Nanoarchaeota archaeon]